MSRLGSRVDSEAAMKTGFQNPESRQYTGEVILADIGVPYKPPRE